MTAHRADRPLWTCALDRDEWPCLPARAGLVEAYRLDRPLLSAHLAVLMSQAAGDLGLADPTRLYRRFVAWSLERHRACRVCGRAGHDAVPGAPPRLVPCDTLNPRTRTEHAG
jgi:hypothetical protein